MSKQLALVREEIPEPTEGAFYRRTFSWKDGRTNGFTFWCDADGKIKADRLCGPEYHANAKACTVGHLKDQVIDEGVVAYYYKSDLFCRRRRIMRCCVSEIESAEDRPMMVCPECGSVWTESGKLLREGSCHV